MSLQSSPRPSRRRPRADFIRASAPSLRRLARGGSSIPPATRAATRCAAAADADADPDPDRSRSATSRPTSTRPARAWSSSRPTAPPPTMRPTSLATHRSTSRASHGRRRSCHVDAPIDPNRPRSLAKVAQIQTRIGASPRLRCTSARDSRSKVGSIGQSPMGADPELHGCHAARFFAWCGCVGTGVAAS